MPRYHTSYPVRDLDCQEALEDAFQTLLSLAAKAGWTTTESAVALQKLASAYLKLEEENHSTALQIAQALADTSTKH